MQPVPEVRDINQKGRLRDRLTSGFRKSQRSTQPSKTIKTNVLPTTSNVCGQSNASSNANTAQAAQAAQPTQPAATVDSNASVSKQSLWEKAYGAKQAECPELVQSYEDVLSIELGVVDARNPAILERLVECQMQKVETQKWKLTLAERPFVVREQVARVVKAITCAKEFVAPIANTDPHAGLAWAGICIFLPLLCGPVEQEKAIAEGIDEICSILYRFVVLERLYAGSETDPALSKLADIEKIRAYFESSAGQKLSGVIEFQARVACYCNRRSSGRYIRDVLKSDDWVDLMKQIKLDSRRTQDYVETLQAEDFEHRLDIQARRLHHISKSIDETLGLTHKTLPMIRTELSRLERLNAEKRHKCLES